MLTRSQSRTTTKRYGLLTKGDAVSVVSIGLGERSCKNTGYSYDDLSNRATTSVCRRALKSGRKALREGYPTVDDHRAGQYSLVGVSEDFREATLIASLASSLLSAQNTLIQHEEAKPTSSYMGTAEYDERLVSRRVSEARQRLMLYVESVFGGGFYDGLRNLGFLSGEELLTRALHACLQVPFPTPDDDRDHLVEPELVNFLIWLLDAIPTVLRLRSFDYSKEQSNIFLATTYLRAALPLTDEFLNDPRIPMWNSMRPIAANVGMPEMVAALERALEAMRFWSQLRDKGTPMAWAAKYVRNKTGLALQDYEMRCLEEFMTEHPIRDSFDQWYLDIDSPRNVGRIPPLAPMLDAYRRSVHGRASKLYSILSRPTPSSGPLDPKSKRRAN